MIVAQTAKLLQEFYPARVMSRLDKTEAEFWEGKHLELNDWQGRLGRNCMCVVIFIDSELESLVCQSLSLLKLSY